MRLHSPKHIKLHVEQCLQLEMHKKNLHLKKFHDSLHYVLTIIKNQTTILMIA
jgi:hypothetical protein